MTMATEADVRKLQAQMEDVQKHIAQIYATISALIEQHDDSAIIEGADVKARPNGKVKGGKTHR